MGAEEDVVVSEAMEALEAEVVLEGTAVSEDTAEVCEDSVVDTAVDMAVLAVPEDLADMEVLRVLLCALEIVAHPRSPRSVCGSTRAANMQAPQMRMTSPSLDRPCRP